MARCGQVLPAVKRVSRAQRIDLGLVMGIIRVESRYKASARNRRTGASGLMQVMPGTGRYFKCGDLLDAEENITCGIRVLKRYLAMFKGNMTYGVAAYHAGPVRPKRAYKAGRLPKNFSYVEKVLRARTRFLRRGCY